MSDYYAVKCLSLVDAAKRIFGDIVKDAYLVSEYYDSGNKAIADALMDDAEDFDCADDIVLPDDSGVVIVFNNDHKVLFSISEWGTIEEFNYSPLFVSR